MNFSVSNPSIASVSASGGLDSGASDVLIDSSLGATATFTVTGLQSGTTTINISLTDYNYEDSNNNDHPITGSASVGILVQ